MRHGRLASALAVAGFTGLAAAQDPSQFAVDRQPESPAVVAPAPVMPAALGLPVTVPVADQPATVPAPVDAKPAEAKPADPKPMPSSAGGAAPTTNPPMISVLSPGGSAPLPGTTVLPPTGVVLPPDGGTIFVGPGTGVLDPSRYWVSAEYLAWRIKKDQAPPLVTTGPASFPVGFLGNPGTRVLFPGELDAGTLSGARLSAGLWLDDAHTFGLIASGFWLNEKENSTTFSSNQFPVLARPIFSVNPSGPFSEFLAFPGLATGSITIQNETKFCGASLAATCPIWGGCHGQVYGLGGVQYLSLRERLTIVETPRGTANNPFPGGANTQFILTDSFETKNEFYGAFLGAAAYTSYGSWLFGLTAQVAAGWNRQTLEINGSTVTIPPVGSPTTAAGGLLALPGANIGRFTRDEFSVVPQLGLNVGYQLTPNLQVFGGYTVLYWQNVIRPGTEVDPQINLNRVPGFGTFPPPTANRPAVLFNQTDFWAQGVNFGIRYAW